MAHDPAESTPLAASDAESLYARIGRLIPGILLCALIAKAALLLRHWSGLSALSPMIVSIALGAFLHNALGTPSAAKPGVAFSLRWILRSAIVLLGFQLTAHQVVDVGATGMARLGLPERAFYVLRHRERTHGRAAEALLALIAGPRARTKKRTPAK